MPSSNKLVQCSNCGKKGWIHHYHYKKNLEKFEVPNLIELNKKYICQECRAVIRNTALSYVNKSPMYKQTQTSLQEEVYTYLKRGLNNPEARDNFINNVKAILEKCHVKNYSFYIVNNMLKGIKIEQIPFWGNIMIPLQSER